MTATLPPCFLLPVMEAEVLNHRYGMASMLDGKLACSVMDGSNGYVNTALIPKAFPVQDAQF